LGTGEVVEVQRALQLGWRPTTPEEEEEEDKPEYHEVDLMQEWNMIGLSGIVPSMGRARGEGVGEVPAVPSTSQGAEKVREAPVVKIFLEKSSWAELEGQPISKVHEAIMKKLKGTPKTGCMPEQAKNGVVADWALAELL
jgi:hypothetical protein